MKITALYVYPIKALRGIELESAQIGSHGVRHDRSFMLYEVRPTGELKKMQLDSHPKCALFEQRIVPGSVEGQSMVVVRYHGDMAGIPDDSEEDLNVPLEPDVASLEKINVDLHGSPAAAYRMGESYDAWLSQRFGCSAMLVYIGDGKRAVLGKSLLPRNGLEEQQQTGWMSSLSSYIAGPQQPPANDSAPWLTFTDVAPLLVTSEPSLQDVCGRLPDSQPVGMYKFRPNIVVDGEGEAAWAEDFWAELSIHSNQDGTGNQKHTLLLTGNCVRCTSLNVDYQTGKPATGELGTVLKKLMKDRRVDQGMKWSPVFGRYAFPEGCHGGEGFTLSVGDVVEVTRRNAERSVWDWPNM
ncbi:Molybdenum cofactor sulfurase [Madurella mycetomatis]|uniref:Molybdenum cofactor sulfurase n=1 Tax=Madurella mycetomatis TaxID=100816 RepID=A0A175WIH0_9PEZI|nr:Molybdenum cofactor sulfurase [Madurella mycetomatis]